MSSKAMGQETLDLGETMLPDRSAPPERKRALRLTGSATALYRTSGSGFETSQVPALELGFDGLAGDRHGGLTRRAGGREPWYKRGTEIRNERQVSLLSAEELGETAEILGIDEIRPEWVGANLLIAGIARLTFLPPRTLLMFAGGVTLKIDGDNAPCRAAGHAVARHYAGRADIPFAYVRAAKHRRGLVGWVEKPGRIEAGETFEARVPEQWIYGS
ncbi:MAG: MOSC domain-containing protein [Aurantimonas endophytica]|uniref:MOSC domain-containing protein n=1 Tax=Aurantimonas endophytica TaxID=1522175 RepID=UPI003001D4E4